MTTGNSHRSKRQISVRTLPDPDDTQGTLGIYIGTSIISVGMPEKKRTAYYWNFIFLPTMGRNKLSQRKANTRVPLASTTREK